MKVYEFIVTFESLDEDSDIETLKGYLQSTYPIETTLYDFLYESDENTIRFFTVDVEGLKQLIDTSCINCGLDVERYDVKECSEEEYLRVREEIDGDEDAINILDFEPAESPVEAEDVSGKFDFVICGDTTEKEINQVIRFLQEQNITYRIKRINFLRIEKMDITIVFHNIERDGAFLMPSMVIGDNLGKYNIVDESYAKYLNYNGVDIVVEPSCIEDEDVIECFEKAMDKAKMRRPITLSLQMYPQEDKVVLIFHDKKDRSELISSPITDELREKYGIKEDQES